MIISHVPYEFSDKDFAKRILSSNLDLLPHKGCAFVNTCGNGTYYVIVVRDKNNQHFGYFNF